MILICDDDATVRTSLSLVLKRAGYDVATASSPQETIDFVRGDIPELSKENMTESSENSLKSSRNNNIIGKSPLLQQVLNTVSRIAKTNAPVLITGESGTGKELIAEAIHENSARNKNPFVKVNLGGISQSLFESEMFGHKKGAFTDAYHDRTGRFELADKHIFERNGFTVTQ